MKVLTKGNVIVNDIKIDDIHYEYEYGCYIKTKVISLPIRDDNGIWTWDSVHMDTGKIINYTVNEKYPHYSVNLYDYEAYKLNV